MLLSRGFETCYTFIKWNLKWMNTNFTIFFREIILHISWESAHGGLFPIPWLCLQTCNYDYSLLSNSSGTTIIYFEENCGPLRAYYIHYDYQYWQWTLIFSQICNILQKNNGKMLTTTIIWSTTIISISKFVNHYVYSVHYGYLIVESNYFTACMWILWRKEFNFQ